MLDKALAINALKLREDFPILKQHNRGNPLVYLDSAASTQKPLAVINAISDFYLTDYANIHRGIYELSERSTSRYELARKSVQMFIRAKEANEIIFTSGTTAAINLIAHSLSEYGQWQAGDEVILSVAEHHSNLVPWLLLKERIGIILKYIPMHDTGELDIDAYKQLFSARTKLVALSHASNVLGTLNPIEKFSEIAHSHRVPILVDGAQVVPHMPVNVQDLDCDFYVFSAHKFYGPTGIGALYAKKNWIEQLPPHHGGGGMIETVSLDQVTFVKGPTRFEAGTPDIAGAIGFAAAIDYLNKVGMQNVFAHETALLDYAEAQLLQIPNLKIIGTHKPKVGVISFVIEDIHPHDLGTVLDHEGIAVRAGHHCAMPLMTRFGVPATVRLSFGIYNTHADVDACVAAIQLAKRIFS